VERLLCSFTKPRLDQRILYMKAKRAYIAAAFNARPLGMPIPLNWFGLAAFALLGALLHPGFWLIGAGLEGLYLWTLSRNPRFRTVVDATSGQDRPDIQYETLSAHLDPEARRRQAVIEQQAGEISALLQGIGSTQTQINDMRHLAWLHLKLLAARAALQQVVATAARETGSLAEQEQRITQRLGQGDTDDELRRSLEQQLSVIRARQEAHADGARRSELIDAELDRLRQQLSLVREQALLAADEHGAAQSLDALSASLNEANRWLKDQRELFAGIDDLTDAPPPDIRLPKKGTRRNHGIKIKE
jgi:hypothetical protein